MSTRLRVLVCVFFLFPFIAWPQEPGGGGAGGCFPPGTAAGGGKQWIAIHNEWVKPAFVWGGYVFECPAVRGLRIQEADMVDDIVDKVIKKQYYYTPIDEETLKKEFYGKSGKSQGGKIEYAYQRACELRDFEIDKFWMRSKYFWGFVSIILGAYAALVQSDYSKKIQNGEMPNPHFDLCLLLIGFLCAIIWLLVLWGSKAWYEHWEIMICFLEDDITGPLYKTGTYQKSRKYYSVSKLNIMLAVIYIIVFAGLLIQYLCRNYVPAIHMDIDAIDWFVTVALFVTVIVSIILFFGFPKCDRISEDQKGKVTFYNQWGNTCNGCRKPHCMRDCSKTPPHMRRTCF